MSVRLTAGDGTSQTFDTQLMVQRGVLDGPLFDQSGAMSSILSLGGLGFTLPSSLPSFLAGSSIGFDLPSKYIPQIGINLDGSAYFAMGISMKDVTGADDAALWKTQDQADLEKRQREVEKEATSPSSLPRRRPYGRGRKANGFSSWVALRRRPGSSSSFRDATSRTATGRAPSGGRPCWA